MVATRAFSASVAREPRPGVELPAEEQDSSPEVDEGAEASCRVLQGPDDAVEAFYRRVRDGMGSLFPFSPTTETFHRPAG